MVKNLVKRAIRKFLYMVFDKPLAPPTNREKELVNELKAIFYSFPCQETINYSSSEKAWADNMNRLRELVINNNPREFLRWDVIWKTMFVGNAKYIFRELNYLRRNPEWESRWRKAIQEVPTGHPVPYFLFPVSSGNLIHHAYHLAQFEEKTALRVNDMSCIFEFGGGYGSMCRLLYNLGFHGKYIVYDLKAFSALQQFFLRSINVPVYSIDLFKAIESGVFCISDLEQLKIILSNNIDTINTLFVATWSISEVPIDIRSSVLPLISKFHAFLIAYQETFGEVNNIDFFKNWKDDRKDLEWLGWQIRHLPRNYYLVGKRKMTR